MQFNIHLIQPSCVDADSCVGHSLDGNFAICRHYYSDDSHTLIVAPISNPIIFNRNSVV